MNCEYELDFLREVLKKCHVRTAMLSLHDTTDHMVDSFLNTIIGLHADEALTIQRIIGDIENQTAYKFTNELKLQYLFMRLPLLSERNLLFIGPYLSFPLSSKEVLEIGESLRLTPNMQKLFSEYYTSLPVIPESDRLFTTIDTFCERVWQTNAFSAVEINKTHTLSVSLLGTASNGDNIDENLANMEKIERRYAFENELIEAVVLGQQHKEKLLLSTISGQMFDKRLQDPLRNAKNYCIIMNTLLRKAAERGGVHPMHIDRVSGKLALKIEQTPDLKGIPEVMRETFSSYCRLVRKHATQQFSPVVKKAVLMIDADISAELLLHTLAERLEITPGYLATVFKRETGKTVSEYVRDKRIERALHLLNTTNLQIQTIAMHCGIMDVQYFSKIFKRKIGKTPKEYREALRR